MGCGAPDKVVEFIPDDQVAANIEKGGEQKGFAWNTQIIDLATQKVNQFDQINHRNTTWLLMTIRMIQKFFVTRLLWILHLPMILGVYEERRRYWG